MLGAAAGSTTSVLGTRSSLGDDLGDHENLVDTLAVDGKAKPSLVSTLPNSFASTDDGDGNHAGKLYPMLKESRSCGFGAGTSSVSAKSVSEDISAKRVAGQDSCELHESDNSMTDKIKVLELSLQLEKIKLAHRRHQVAVLAKEMASGYQHTVSPLMNASTSLPIASPSHDESNSFVGAGSIPQKILIGGSPLNENAFLDLPQRIQPAWYPQGVPTGPANDRFEFTRPLNKRNQHPDFSNSIGNDYQGGHTHRGDGSTLHQKEQPQPQPQLQPQPLDQTTPQVFVNDQHVGSQRFFNNQQMYTEGHMNHHTNVGLNSAITRPMINEHFAGPYNNMQDHHMLYDPNTYFKQQQNWPADVGESTALAYASSADFNNRYVNNVHARNTTQEHHHGRMTNEHYSKQGNGKFPNKGRGARYRVYRNQETRVDRSRELMLFNAGPGPPIQTSDTDQGPEGANLFVFHLPNWCSNVQLLQLFSPHGNVLSCRIFVDKISGRSRGFGFVSFSGPDEAKRAIKFMNGYKLGHKRLKVELKRGRTGRLRRISRQGISNALVQTPDKIKKTGLDQSPATSHSGASLVTNEFPKGDTCATTELKQSETHLGSSAAGIYSGTNSKQKAMNVSNANLNARLWKAAGRGNLDEVNRLFNKGAALDWHNEGQGGMHAIHHACQCCQLTIIQWFVAKGVDIHLVDFDGNTPLHVAAMHGHMEVFSYLHSNGAVIDRENKAGETPLDLAKAYNKKNLARLILSLSG